MKHQYFANIYDEKPTAKAARSGQASLLSAIRVEKLSQNGG